MDEKEAILKLIAKIESVIQDTNQDLDILNEFSENSKEFLKKYGHI